MKYITLNNIAQAGLDALPADFEKTDNIEEANAVLVRSASMLDMQFSENLEAIGRVKYEEVRVQSLHVIPGEEFLRLRDTYVKDFKNNIYAEFFPGAVCSVLFSINFKNFTVNGDCAGFVVRFYRMTEVTALSGIVFKKMSKHFGACEVVYSDYFIAFCSEHLSECETADTTETVDCNFN